jgi:hypothetical protein
MIPVTPELDNQPDSTGNIQCYDTINSSNPTNYHWQTIIDRETSNVTSWPTTKTPFVQQLFPHVVMELSWMR